MQLDYFYGLTPRQYHNIEKGYFAKQNNRSMELWNVTRKVMWAALAPNSKNLKEQDVLQFPWETESLEKMDLEDFAKLEEEIDEVKEFYRKRDEKKKSQN